jgi:hypothetical protein
MNRNVRFMFNYLHGTVDKFSAAAATAWADIGAHFDALAISHPHHNDRRWRGEVARGHERHRNRTRLESRYFVAKHM